MLCIYDDVIDGVDGNVKRSKTLTACLTAVVLPTIVIAIVVLHFYLFSISL